MTQNHYDILIIGGGMIGASMALALSQISKMRIGMIDSYRFDTSKSRPSYDDRSVALSFGSSLIFQGLGIWQNIEPHSCHINHIHVSDKGRLGATRLHAQKEKVPALGYVIENKQLGKVLYDALEKTNVEMFAPANLTQFETLTDKNTATINYNGTAQRLSCDLLIAADGSQSTIRRQLGIACQRYDYQQSAIIANVSSQQPHSHWAYERFTASGPLALLPLNHDDSRESRLSLVWTHDSDNVDATMSLNDKEFLEKLQDTFGYRIGHFSKVGKRVCYPLQRMQSQLNGLDRTVIIGNASHTLHPVAGQGFNLGLRDVAVLTDLIQQAKENQEDIGSRYLLQSYQQKRKADHDSVINYTDTLISLFSNEISALAHLRAGGLMAVDRVPILRRLLASRSMGLEHRQAKLSRGISLR